MECKYCGKKFKNKKGLSQHQKQYCNRYKENRKKEIDNYKFICICGKKFPTSNSLNGHKAKCKVFRKYINEERSRILTKDFLMENLIYNNYSSNYTAKIINNDFVDSKIVMNYAKRFGIKTKTIKEAANSTHVRELYKKTCKEKYGKENALCRGTDSFKKRNNTVRDRYGVENVFQVKEIKEKLVNSMLENYGVTNPIYIKNRHKNNGRKSAIHKKIEKFLIENSVNFESEKVINLMTYNNYLKKKYNPRPDIIIENKKIIIEINGDYWHANPKVYVNSDVIVRWNGEMLAEDIWNFDKERRAQMMSLGYKVINIWENDIVNRFDEVKEMLCKELELNQ